GGVCITSPTTREPSSSTVSHALSGLVANSPEAIRVVTVAITLELNGSATRNCSALSRNSFGSEYVDIRMYQYDRSTHYPAWQANQWAVMARAILLPEVRYFRGG